ncbi:hypothetical protein HDU79_008706, partial [Rhizoclosmatium sp. JEL0117]
MHTHAEAEPLLTAPAPAPTGQTPPKPRLRRFHFLASFLVCGAMVLFAALLVDASCSGCLATRDPPPPPPPPSFLWPMPSHVAAADDTALLSYKPRSFKVKASNLNDKFIDNALSVLKKSLRAKHRNGHGKDYPISIHVDQPDKVKHAEDLVDANEGYELDVTAEGAFIKATNKIGVVYALQTLSQLITSSGSIVLTSIKDSPKFPYRGLLLDTARNYFSPKDIKRVLDGMAFSKLNVLHWHLFDSQAFPMEWPLYPQIHTNSAYRDKSGSLKVYSKKEIKEIVEYAFERNIRVIPEFEVPGHNAVFGHVDESFVAGWNHTPWDEYCVQPPCGQAIVDKGEVVQLIDDLITDVGGWFRDPVVHVGHDEVNLKSWGDIDVKAMMRRFETELVGILEKNGRQYAGWDEIADLYGIEDLVPKDALVTIWRSPSTDRVKAALKAGFTNIVVGPSSHWYLDCSPSAPWCQSAWEKQNPSDTAYDIPGYLTHPGQWHNWTTVYSFDPLYDVPEPSVIKGGFGALWSETIKKHNIDRFLFPRLSVIGERLWSYDSVEYSAVDTKQRLERFRASLVNELEIDAAELGYLGNKEGMVYRPELCDGVEEGEGWQIGPQLEGNPVSEGTKGSYCSIARLYDTEKFVHNTPKKVKIGRTLKTQKLILIEMLVARRFFQTSAVRRSQQTLKSTPIASSDFFVVSRDVHPTTGEPTGVVTVAFNSPKNLNAMTEPIGIEFQNLIRNTLSPDTSIRALILTGSDPYNPAPPSPAAPGKKPKPAAFSAGGDLKFLRARTQDLAHRNAEIMRDFYARFLSIRQAPFPTIAAINGHAVGAGACISLACDLRLMAGDNGAKIGFNFVKLGLTPGM